MTVSSTPRKAGPLLGTGAQSAFPFAFKVFVAGDVLVAHTSVLGEETTLVLDVDYTVTLNSNQDTSPGGTVSLTAAPAVGEKVTIVGDVDYDQPLDLPSGGNYNPLALENQLDRIAMQAQQLREVQDRTLRFPASTPDGAATLPSVAVRAGKLLGFDSSGNLNVNAPASGSAAELALDLASTASGKGGFLVKWILNAAGAGARWVSEKLSETASLADFGADPAHSASVNSVAVTAALAWMSSSGGSVVVRGLYAINGDMPVLSGGFHFIGQDKYSDGFLLAPQSAAITGGVHAYFLPSSSTNTSRMVFENLSLKSTYNSATWAGSTVFSGIHCAPNSGVTHSNIELRNCYLFDPSFTMVYLAPKVGGLVKRVRLRDVEADVTDLATSSRIANVIQTIIEGIDYAGHSSTYNLKQIIDVQISGGSGRGWRTYADLKRGTYKFDVSGVFTEEMSDCHHSTDGAYFGAIRNVRGRQTSPDLPTKNFVNLAGEDLTLDGWQYDGTLALGAIAAVLCEAYAYPSEAATAYHQPARLRITNGTASGVAQNAVRLLDPVDCLVDGVSVSSITGSAVSIEHPAVTSNGGANAAIPLRNTVNKVIGFGSVGAFGVNTAAQAIGTKIGEVSGFAANVTGADHDPLVPTNENPNRHVVLDSAGVLTGWGLSASCTASSSSDAPVWAAQSVLLNGANAAAVDLVGLNNRVRVDPGGVVSVRASTKLGTAAACGVLFQEFDASGGFLLSDFQDKPSNNLSFTEGILYHQVTNSACTNVKVFLAPNTNYNDAAAIGTSYWADVVVTKGTA